MENTIKKKYRISGMTCAACASTIERKTQGVSGVLDVNVNLVANTLTVIFSDINEEALFQTVQSLGYGINQYTSYRATENTSSSNNYKFIAIIILGVLLTAITMGAMFDIRFLVTFANWLDGKIFATVQLILITPIIILNFETFKKGLKSLVKGFPNMDSLVSISVIAAVIYSLYLYILILFKGINLWHHLYFETAGMILTIIYIGKTIEQRAKMKTKDSVESLAKLIPTQATVIRNDEYLVVSVEDILYGDTILIRPGERIPLDGEIIEGQSYVDQSTMTGESMPVQKKPGDMVMCSTINGNNPIKVIVKKTFGNTKMDEILYLVEEASTTKAPIEKIADKISRVFVPIIMAISIVTFIIWMIITKDFEQSLSTFIAILVIACPCALGLATPTSIVVSLGRGAERGILIKKAEILERLAKVTTIVFDKTNTITNGVPEVLAVIGNNPEKILAIVCSIEQNFEHPIAKAIVEYAKTKKIDLLPVNDFTNKIGFGISGIVNNQRYYIGSKRYMLELGHNSLDNILSQPAKVFLSNGDEIVGALIIADTLRENALNAIKCLQKRNLEVIVLTGDTLENTNAVIPSELGIEIVAEVLPDGKDQVIKNLQSNGKIVAMVGDGINDAIALTRADIGITIGSATDVAMDVADVIIVNNNIESVETAIRLSKKTLNNILQNMFWALIYNVIAVVMVTGVYFLITGRTFNPMFSAIAMSVSSIIVVLNALRLRNFDKKSSERNYQLMLIKVEIEGMTCTHCVNHVEKALQQIPDVKVEVNLKKKHAIIRLLNTEKQNITDQRIKELIEEAGYQVKSIIR